MHWTECRSLRIHPHFCQVILTESVRDFLFYFFFKQPITVYTKHYWRWMPAHFPCVYSCPVLNPDTFWKKAYFSFARCIQYILHSTLDTVSLWLTRCAPKSMILWLLSSFPCLHLLVVAAFHRISASVHQNPTVDRRDDVFLPWLVVGAGPSKNASKPFA